MSTKIIATWEASKKKHPSVIFLYTYMVELNPYGFVEDYIITRRTPKEPYRKEKTIFKSENWRDSLKAFNDILFYTIPTEQQCDRCLATFNNEGKFYIASRNIPPYNTPFNYLQLSARYVKQFN